VTEPLLRAERLVKHFPVRSGLFGRARGAVQAVDDISFELYPGETLALVGESGCGKSTAGKLLLRLIEPTAGTVYFQGRNLLDLPERRAAVVAEGVERADFGERRDLVAADAGRPDEVVERGEPIAG